MALAAEFNDVEHFQSVCRSYVNKLIRADFKDLGGDDWEPVVNTSRGSMRVALTHNDNDSLILTESRLLLYYLVYGKCKSLQADIYGIPKSSFDEQRKYRPQINLYFSQNTADVPDGKRKLTGEISFRLMNETATTITQTELNTYAKKIKDIFAVPSKYVWNKGKLLVSYSDWDKGYQLQLLVNTKAEGKDLIAKVLDIQGHTPNYKFMNVSENEESTEAYPANPGTENILGESHRKPQRRRTENVVFRYATISIRGGKRGINLVDTSKRRRNAIEVV